MGTFYKMALSSTELSNIYSHPCDAPDTTNLKLWLPLKSYHTSVSHSGYAEGTYPGSTIKDYSKYGATGTYTKNTSRPYDIAWDWTFDTTCFVNGTAVCQWKDYKVADGYRFGFNGKEKDDETYGEGDEYDYGARVYDARIGKFLSVDPITNKYPWYSPYQFAGNKPIWAIDLDGKEELLVQEGLNNTKGWKMVIEILNSTRVYANFLTKLSSQQNYNILVIQTTYVSSYAVPNGISSGRSYGNSGELKEDAFYKDLTQKDLENIESTTFSKGKRLIITGLRVNNVAKLSDLEETYEKSKSTLRYNFDKYDEMVDLLGEIAMTTIHELVAHDLKDIDRKVGFDNKNSRKNAEKNHKDWQNYESMYSPTHSEIIKDVLGEYKDTKAKKAYKEIEKEVNKKYKSTFKSIK